MPTAEDDQQRRIGGRYRLSAQLGAGAMGTVWSGYDEVLQRWVALKELKVPPGVPEHEALALRERMLREARALGGLSHPNVITVYDVVDADGEPMVVLEMVQSRNLAAMIAEQGTLSTEQAAVVGFATAAALRAAHRSGITHRDVKPSNVLVADDGRVKLTDFGIARNAADAPMTTAGLVLGSPAYIAPEVAAGQPVTPSADLWGLGATLFAATEGRPPYDMGNPVSTITEVVDGEVPRPLSAGPLAGVIMALMVKDPDRRIPLEEVRRRLRPLIADPDDPLYPGSPDAPILHPPVHQPAGRTASVPFATGAGPLVPGPQLAGPQLAGTPGPLPPMPPRVSAPPRIAAPRPAAFPVPGPAPGRAALSGWAATGLVLAGALIVLLGAAGGWTGTRVLAGQPPLSTVTVTTERTALRAHTDVLGFAAQVPRVWTEYRYAPAGAEPSVSFVSPDGSEELAVRRAPSPAAMTEGLTPMLLGVDTVAVAEPRPVGDGAMQLVYDTAEGSLRRTTWLRTVPATGGAWSIRLTVPADRPDDIGAALFDVLASGFVPPTA